MPDPIYHPPKMLPPAWPGGGGYTPPPPPPNSHHLSETPFSGLTRPRPRPVGRQTPTMSTTILPSSIHMPAHPRRPPPTAANSDSDLPDVSDILGMSAKKLGKWKAHNDTDEWERDPSSKVSSK
jgi:hypothetical protein